jgi:hypothetical protein
MHLDSAIKVDLIVRKNSEYRQTEVERRKSVEFAGISTWITSREDLILSKLVWARDSGLGDASARRPHADRRIR